MLAKIVNDDVFQQEHAVPVGPSRASSLLQGGTVISDIAFAFDLAVASAFDLDLLPLSQRPNAGVAQGATRHGCRVSRPRPWMADGGGPPEQCRSEGMPSLGEAPNGGAKPFAYFSLGRHSGVWKSESL